VAYMSDRHDLPKMVRRPLKYFDFGVTFVTCLFAVLRIEQIHPAADETPFRLDNRLVVGFRLPLRVG
jgi:hypothetical protein